MSASSIVMFPKFLNRLEDPKNPLLGPNLKALKLWGLLLPKSELGRFCVYLMNFLCIIFMICEYIDVWLVRSDLEMVFNNLRISMISPFNYFKVTMLYIMHQNWKDIIDYVSRADIKMRLSKDPRNVEIIANNTKYCRIVTYVYWCLTILTALSIMTTPITSYMASETYRQNLKNGTTNYIEVIRCWVPFDKTKFSGYLFACMFQTLILCYISGVIASYDANAVVMMMFFKTEIMVLENDSSKIFNSNQSPIDDGAFKRNIKECHRRHAELLKYTSLFNSCLSSIMFFYVIVCSMMLCAAAYETTIETNKLNYVARIQYLTFGIAQLLMTCWHCNEVTLASQKLMTGPYRSVWWCQRKEHLRDMIILTNQFDKNIIFNAGPFTDLTVATFINILKGAYSYFTLMK